MNAQPDTAARPADGRPQAGCPQRRLDERGGAVSLIVILIVPALALAAVAAAAIPRRLAAQAALDSTAAQLAAMTVHWRHAQDRPHGPLDWHHPLCIARTHTAPDVPDGSNGPDSPTDPDGTQDPDTEPDPAEQPALQRLCEAAAASLDASLSAAGVDAARLAGYHTSSLSTIGPDTDNPAHQPSVPCRIDDRTVAADAVLAAATAPLADDWATGQIWPDGITLQAHATAHIARPDADTDDELPDCTPLAASNATALAESAPGASAFGNVAAP